MRIAILTMHNANNYGAVLQAVATQAVFSRYGTAQIVDYHNSHTSSHSRVIRFDASVLGVARAGKDLLRFSNRRRAMLRFRQFLLEHGRLTETAKSESELTRVARFSDILVSGSDQIWSKNCATGGRSLDPVYFLSFAQKPQRKISYASSWGAKVFGGAPENELYKLLIDFEAISMREDTSAALLSKLLGRPVFCALDPTLLLTANDWSQMALEGSIPYQEYVLAYVFHKDSLTRRAVQRVENEMDMPVVVVDQDLGAGMGCNLHVRDAGPGQFLQAFLNASYVVSDSYHGACFAVNFGKPIFALARRGNSNRVESLFRVLGISQRLAYTLEQVEKMPVIYSNFNQKEPLKEARSASLGWIEKALKVASG